MVTWSSGAKGLAASEIAGQLDIDLSAEDEEQGGPTAQNRKSGLGALQEFVVGSGSMPSTASFGPFWEICSGCAPERVCASPRWPSATAPAAALDIVDLRKMGLNAWLSDAVPHLVYGLATAIFYDALANNRVRA